jgi:hypothetical protein
MDRIFTDFTDIAHRLERWLESVLVYSIPFRLPIEIRQIGVRLLPYIALIFAIQFIPSLLSVVVIFGLGWLVQPLLGLGLAMSTFHIIDVLYAGITLYLIVFSIKPLFNCEYDGWQRLFYVWCIHVLYQCIFGSAIASLAPLLASVFFLFQLKSEYR